MYQRHTTTLPLTHYSHTALQVCPPSLLSFGTSFLFPLNIIWAGVILKRAPTTPEYLGAAVILLAIGSTLLEKRHEAAVMTGGAAAAAAGGGSGEGGSASTEGGGQGGGEGEAKAEEGEEGPVEGSLGQKVVADAPVDPAFQVQVQVAQNEGMKDKYV